MSARGLTLARAVTILREHELQDSDRYVDLGLSLRICSVDDSGPTPVYKTETDEQLIEIGGRWNRKTKKWIGEARSLQIVRVPRGSEQEQPARWIAEWFRRAGLGVKGAHWNEPAAIPGPLVVEFRRVWTLILVGGRRAGKSHLAVVALAMLMILAPRAIVWAISPTQDETDELEQAMRSLLPTRWFTETIGKTNKGVQFKLANGSRLLYLSGHKPRGLKRGRCDMALLNEAQNMYRATWRQLRGAIADRGGLVILSCNPPDAEIGRWIEPAFEKARAKKIKAEAFTMTAVSNPFSDWTALEDMAAEEDDELTFRREVLGEFVPIGDVVFHAWSDSESVRDVPEGFVDITAIVTRRELGRAFAFVVGMDFQRTPHMCAAVLKIYRDPADPESEIPWVVDEVVRDDASEYDLIDALEREGYRGSTIDGESAERSDACAVVADASGWTQDGAHHLGKTSESALRSRRWVHLYKPQKDSDKNPDIVERIKATNARLKNAAGKRRMFSVRDNEGINRAMRSWENRNGVPYRRSDYAHLCDAVSYVIYRLYGRPKVKRAPSSYMPLDRFKRRGLLGG